MQTVALVASCLGTACGGLFADLMYNRLGPRWGRALPIGLVLILCAVTYGLATQMPTAWGVVAALTMMAFLVDLGIPSIWAFAQDVGGRHVGAALGWGNMWGNFGAAASPVALQMHPRQLRVGHGLRRVCRPASSAGPATGLNLNALVPGRPPGAAHRPRGGRLPGAVTSPWTAVRGLRLPCRMTSDDTLGPCDAIQVDVGSRGLARDPADNLFTACPDDFATACRSIAEHPAPRVGVVTGFMIPSVEPPTGETDGPLGALFLARAFHHLGIPTVLFSDAAGYDALWAGLEHLGLATAVPLIDLPMTFDPAAVWHSAGR